VLLLAAAVVIDVDDDDACRIAQRCCSAGAATVGRGAAAIDTQAKGGEVLLALRAQRIRTAPRTARERISFFFLS
jgi:hypothetical protein